MRTLMDRQLQMFPHLYPPESTPPPEVSHEPRPQVAVLVDAENVPSACWPRVRRIVQMLGDIAVVRAYSCAASGWGPSRRRDAGAGDEGGARHVETPLSRYYFLSVKRSRRVPSSR